jgi:N-acyl-D-aspartate/D-glutamate deacylase
MVDVVLRGGEVVDGTGAPARRADVAVRDGRVAAVGDHADFAEHIADPPARTIDADGLVIAPGFVDIHTHYDAQLLWDPAASPSPHHGVTTVVGGNCGFSIAPLEPEHVDYVMRMMARVEGIPLDALRAGPAWDWTGFGEWLDRLDGTLVVNAGFLAGHSTIRRLVMGDDAVGKAASREQIDAMVALAHGAMAAGALGLSSSLGEAHTDGDGQPVPSRAARPDEFLALARAVGDHPGTSLEFIAAMGEIPQDRIELMTDMSLAANRPLNWNLLGSLSPTEVYEQQLTACDWASEHGAHVVALALPDLMRMRSSRMLHALPGWADVIHLPADERQRALIDPAVRQRLHAGAEQAAGGSLGAYTRWDLIEIAEATSPATAGLVGRTVADIAAERRTDAVDVLLDVVVPAELPLALVFPSLVPSLGTSDEGWRVRAEVWQDDRVVLGGSDAGAHLDIMCHANYTTMVLGHAVRERKLLPLEAAVRLLTDVPARLYGLRGRGRVEVGAHADLVVFDPERVGSEAARVRHDLPGGAPRLFAESLGVEHVLVAGREVVRSGRLTGERGGTVVRSGIDTDTVTVPGGRS